MDTHGGAPAEAAITASERRFRIRIQVDWDRDGSFDHELRDLGPYCSEVTVDRALEGSTPSEIMLVEGSSSAELNFTVGGEWNGLPFTGVFSPYNGLSPLYLNEMIGCEVKYWIGIDCGAVGIVWYQQFTGNIRTISPDRGSGTVKISALDRAEKLRQVIQFAPWAVSDWSSLGQSVQNQMLSSTWIIDNCLRLCDVSPTPYRPKFRSEMGVPEDSYDGTFFWLTANGGWIPTIGFVDNVPVQKFQPDGTTPMYKESLNEHDEVDPSDSKPLAFKPNVNGGEVTNRFWMSNRDRINSPATHYLGVTLLSADAEDTNWWMSVARTEIYTCWIGNWRKIVVVVGDTGKIWTELIDYDTATTRASAKLTIPTMPSNPYSRVSVVWDLSPQTGTRVYLRCGATSFGGWQSLSSLPASSSAYDPLKGLVEIQRSVAMADFVYQARNIFGASTSNEAGAFAKYSAVLDQGKNRASYIPNRSGDAWEVIKAVAAAEMGSVFWTEEGVFKFWNYERILAMQETPVRTLSLDHVSGLNIEWSSDSVRNIWTTTTKKKRSVWPAVIYESRDPSEFIVEPNTTKLFRIWAEAGGSVNPFVLTRYRSSSGAPGAGVPVWDDATTTHGFIPQWWNGSAWAEENRGLGTQPISWFAENGEFMLKIYNGWPEPMRFAGPSDKPYLRLEGTEIVDYGAELATSIKDTVSVAKFGPRNLSLSGDFYQEEIFIQDVAPVLLERTAKPIPATDNIEIAGDPRLMLGDTLRIIDTDGLGELTKVQILGIRRSWDRDTGLTDTLTVEMISTPGEGIWDSPQYGRWDETFIWS